MKKKKKICLINTGGTLGMQAGPRGFEPVPGLLAQQLARVQELEDPTMPDYVISELDPLLDSSNMDPADWSKIAEKIVEVYTAFDGFVIVHGTDTMAYTASALAFMLPAIDKPVVFTGYEVLSSAECRQIRPAGDAFVLVTGVASSLEAEML